MQYEPASSGGGLTSVATDATLTGDGTVGSPLSVVATPPTYSVHKGVLTAGAFAVPLASPLTVYPDANAWFTTTIASTDVSVATGDIVCNNAGTYRITMQFSFDKIPDPSQHDVQVNLGLTDAPPNTPLYETITYEHFESNGTGQFTATFTTIVEATAGQAFQIVFLVGGTPSPATMNYYFGAESGFLLVERVV